MGNARQEPGARTGTVRVVDRVAAWPRVVATVRDDGTGTLTVNGTERPCRAPSVDELRTGVIARCVSLARRLRRPVRLAVTDASGTWNLAVRPEGVVQLVDEAGALPPADGLAPHEGRCRTCRRLQPVTAATCAQCGVDEPHRVEADPVDTRAVVPDAAAVASDPDPADTPADDRPTAPTRMRARRELSLRFSTQPTLRSAQGLALGRNPEPVGGRLAVRVASPERMLSRTHVLVDLDDAGRIVVTDQFSGNGTEAQTQPPTRLTPGTPYVVSPGTTLLLGDVAVQVDVVPSDVVEKDRADRDEPRAAHD